MTHVDAAWLDERCIFLTRTNIVNFPNELKYQPFWLLWTATHQPTKENPLKIIKNPVGKVWQEQRAFFNDLKAPQSHQGYGFLYNDEHPYICVDIDMATPLNDKLVHQLDSYTEWSPSTEGLHVIVRVADVEEKKKIEAVFGRGRRNTKEKRDLFISSGFVTITGFVPPFAQGKAIREHDTESLINILSLFFLDSLATHPAVLQQAQEQQQDKANTQALAGYRKAQRDVNLKVSQVQALLRLIPVQQLTADVFRTFPVLNPLETEEAREPWLIVGQALHNFYDGNIQGYTLWQEWSKGGDKYDSAAIEASWKSFSTQDEFTRKPITIATIIKLAEAQKPAYTDRTAKGAPLATFQNILAFLDFYNISIRYNSITNTPEVTFPDAMCDMAGLPRGHKEASMGIATELIASELLKQSFNGAAVKPVIKAAIQTRAAQNMYCPIKDYFQNTLEPWDGKDRFTELLNTIDCSVTRRLYYATFLRKWLIQVMAAVFSTMAKPNRLNNVLILQGPQGIGKTMWVESLFPAPIRQFCIGSKTVKMSSFRTDMVKLNMELTSTLICNINEIDTVFDPKTYSDFKAFLDQTIDRVVLPYGDTAISSIRRTCFIGSTNKTSFFVDETGNRRFFILAANYFNFKHKIDLLQLWAQAYVAYTAGEPWWLDDVQDRDAVTAQRTTNNSAMTLGNEYIVDMLDNMFDTSRPFSEWQEYRLPQITNLLALSPRHGSSIKIRRTLTLWLKAIPNAKEPYPASKHPRAPWLYLMPPLIGS